MTPLQEARFGRRFCELGLADQAKAEANGEPMLFDPSFYKEVQFKLQELAYEWRVLELWAMAEEQGIDSNGGGGFGLDTRLFTSEQRVEWHRHNGRFVERSETGASRPKLFNFFRYPDGRVVSLNPLLEAVHRE